MPSDRTRGLIPPDPRRLGEEPLAPDEVTMVMRVRGPEGAVRAFAALTAAERGALVARVMRLPPG